jgi:hypothetical protein
MSPIGDIAGDEGWLRCPHCAAEFDDQAPPPPGGSAVEDASCPACGAGCLVRVLHDPQDDA